jgi:hypothetical protein
VNEKPGRLDGLVEKEDDEEDDEMCADDGSTD